MRKLLLCFFKSKKLFLEQNYFHEYELVILAFLNNTEKIIIANFGNPSKTT